MVEQRHRRHDGSALTVVEKPRGLVPFGNGRLMERHL
jgi:hypothetical protein